MKRYYNWEIIAYEESMCEDWIHQLTMAKHHALVSPLHDKDVKEDGTDKKAHYHILVFYPRQQSIQAVYDEFKDLGLVQNQSQIDPIRDTRGAIDYLTHHNAPNKAQYDENLIIAFGGHDYAWFKSKYCKGDDDPLENFPKIKLFCVEKRVKYFSDLSLYASLFQPDWVEAVDNNAYYWNAFIKSLAFKNSNHDKTFIDELMEVSNE